MKATVAPYQTAATCVRIECLNGTTVRLTSYPFDLTMSNATVYKTDYGYEPTAYGASSSMSPPAMDLEGICAVGGVTRDALASGVFDNARVFIFKCNFLAPVEDYEEIGAGFFGKTTLQDDHYRIEGMGLVDVLGQSFGKLFTASCQHTPWDSGCGISAASVTVTGTLTAVTSGYVFRDASRAEAADWFAAGTIQFTPPTARSPCTNRSITRRRSAMPIQWSRDAAGAEPTARPIATSSTSSAFPTCRNPAITSAWGLHEPRRRNRPRPDRNAIPPSGPNARMGARLRWAGGACRR